jgi:alkylated DNA repair dioxygenase AlkB
MINSNDNSNDSNDSNIERFGCGDSYLIKDVITDKKLCDDIFYILRDNEVNWERIEHKGGSLPREISTQVEYYCNIHNNDNCQLNDLCINCEPIYRHPVDYETKLTQYTPSVKYIRDHIVTLLNQRNLFQDIRFNHSLIQWYRSGNDYIGDHCDKTLDIKRNSMILNYSLGATRVLTLRSKKDTSSQSGIRDIQKIELPHNSLFILGPCTNKEYTHGIRPDKRSERDKSNDSKLYEGQRISLTFRNIATYRELQHGRLFGQGAINKELSTNMKGLDDDLENLLQAFSAENRNHDFEWQQYYNKGFDITCFSS